MCGVYPEAAHAEDFWKFTQAVGRGFSALWELPGYEIFLKT
jgi:hypothetical protein